MIGYEKSGKTMDKKGWCGDDFSDAAVPEKLFFFWPNKAVASYSLIHSIVNCRLILMFISFYCYCLKENIFTMNSFNEQIVFLMYDQRIYDDEMIK